MHLFLCRIYIYIYAYNNYLQVQIIGTTTITTTTHTFNYYAYILYSMCCVWMYVLYERHMNLFTVCTYKYMQVFIYIVCKNIRYISPPQFTTASLTVPISQFRKKTSEKLKLELQSLCIWLWPFFRCHSHGHETIERVYELRLGDHLVT